MGEEVKRTLREANKARQIEWDKSNQLTLAYRGNEFAGEAGEVCNVIKKLERERLGIAGSRDTVEHLAEELADTVICADLIAMQEGIDLDAAIEAKFNATSEKVGLVTRLQRLTVGPADPAVERHYYAVDYTGVIHECEDEARVIAAAKQFAETANQNSAVAQARIAELIAEVERLREALQRIAKNARELGSDRYTPNSGLWLGLAEEAEAVIAKAEGRTNG